MTQLSLAVTLLVAAGMSAGVQDDALRQAAQRLSTLSSRTQLTAENRFLHERVSALLERRRKAPAGSFLAGRLELAIQDLLDASERILEVPNGRERDDRSEATRRLMARDLERTYFSLQEGDYFARQSEEQNASQYVIAARRLYQFARAAYDERDYGRVRRLSQASRQIIGGLEKVAQAARGVPDLPRLPEE